MLELQRILYAKRNILNDCSLGFNYDLFSFYLHYYVGLTIKHVLMCDRMYMSVSVRIFTLFINASIFTSVRVYASI